MNIDLVGSKTLLKMQGQEAGTGLNNQKMGKLKNNISRRASATNAHIDFITNKKKTSITLAVPL